MTTVVFAPAFQRHVSVPQTQAEGKTLREVLEAVFKAHPRVRGYVVDDQGAVRRHVTVILNGTAAADRLHLSDPVPEGSEVFVFQALSGG